MTSVASRPLEPIATGASGGEELVDLLDGRREVCVRHEDVLARGRQDAGPDGGPLPAVLRQADHAEGEPEAGGCLLGHGGRPVRGAVVDDEDLGRQRRRAGAEPVGDPREGHGEPLLLVVGGNDEGKGRGPHDADLAS